MTGALIVGADADAAVPAAPNIVDQTDLAHLASRKGTLGQIGFCLEAGKLTQCDIGGAAILVQPLTERQLARTRKAGLAPMEVATEVAVSCPGQFPEIDCTFEDIGERRLPACRNGGKIVAAGRREVRTVAGAACMGNFAAEPSVGLVPRQNIGTVKPLLRLILTLVITGHADAKMVANPLLCPPAIG